MSGASCISGTVWKGQPHGTETKLGNNHCYVVGTNEEAAVLIIHDLLGWKWENVRLLADTYAKEADVTVYLPDFFDGEVVRFDPPEQIKSFDLQAFRRRQDKDVRSPEIFSCARTLRSQYKKVAAVGYCYGGWASFQLGAKGNNLIDCMSVYHPSWVVESEIEKLGVPTQIHAPEHDTQFTPELKSFTNRIVPTLGIDYDYQYYPGMKHPFATRSDINDPKHKLAITRGNNATVGWLKTYLH